MLAASLLKPDVRAAGGEIQDVRIIAIDFHITAECGTIVLVLPQDKHSLFSLKRPEKSMVPIGNKKLIRFSRMKAN